MRSAKQKQWGLGMLWLSSCASLWAKPAQAVQAAHTTSAAQWSIFWVCAVVGLLVFLVLVVSLLLYRRRHRHLSTHFHASTKVDLIWMLVPIFMLVLMAVPALQLLR